MNWQQKTVLCFWGFLIILIIGATQGLLTADVFKRATINPTAANRIIITTIIAGVLFYLFKSKK